MLSLGVRRRIRAGHIQIRVPLARNNRRSFPQILLIIVLLQRFLRLIRVEDPLREVRPIMRDPKALNQLLIFQVNSAHQGANGGYFELIRVMEVLLLLQVPDQAFALLTQIQVDRQLAL